MKLREDAALHPPAVGDIHLVRVKAGRLWHEDDHGHSLAHIIAKYGQEFESGRSRKS